MDTPDTAATNETARTYIKVPHGHPLALALGVALTPLAALVGYFWFEALRIPIDFANFSIPAINPLPNDVGTFAQTFAQSFWYTIGTQAVLVLLGLICLWIGFHKNAVLRHIKWSLFLGFVFVAVAAVMLTQQVMTNTLQWWAIIPAIGVALSALLMINRGVYSAAN